METQKIKTYRRGTVVKLNNDFTFKPRYSINDNSVVLPAGTKLVVYKGKRNGHLYTSIVDKEVKDLCIENKIYSSDIELSADLVSEADKPEAKVAVNDIFVCSWGYEQTNIDFYKVKEIKGKTATLVELNQNKTHTCSMSGTCVPGSETTNTMKKRILTDANGNVAFKMYSFARATKWDGQPEHWSSWH